MWATLGLWSWRRVRGRLRFWYQIFRLTADWTTVVYLYIPALAWAIYRLWQYYRGSWFVGLTPDTTVVLGLSARAWVRFFLTVGLLSIHWSMFGRTAFALNEGDRVFTLLAPLPRWRLVTILWAENAVVSAIVFAMVYLLSAPAVRWLGVAWWQWGMALWLGSLYVAALRLVSAVFPPPRLPRWLRRGLRVVVALLLYLPLVGPLWLQLSGRPWSALELAAAIAASLTASVFIYLPRVSWEPLFAWRGAGMVAQYLFGTVKVMTVRYSMRRLFRWLVTQVEAVRRRQMHRVAWLIATRLLRQRSVLRDWLTLTAAVIVGMYRAPFPWLKVAMVACVVFLLANWWALRVKPLYESPLREQFLINPYLATVAASRLKWWFLWFSAAVWAAGWLF
jgi:hypothetical protein